MMVTEKKLLALATFKEKFSQEIVRCEVGSGHFGDEINLCN
jgi:hypothetical protein